MMTRNKFLGSLFALSCVLACSTTWGQDGGDGGTPGGGLEGAEVANAKVSISKFSGIPRNPTDSSQIHPYWSTYILMETQMIDSPPITHGTEAAAKAVIQQGEQGSKIGHTYAAVMNNGFNPPFTSSVTIRVRVVAGPQLGAKGKISLGGIEAYKSIPSGTQKDFKEEAVTFNFGVQQRIEKRGNYEAHLSPYIE